MPAEPVDRELERSGLRLRASAAWFVLVWLLLAAPGVVLIVVGHGRVYAVGIALAAFSLAPALVAVGLLVAGVVARHSARDRPFA